MLSKNEANEICEGFNVELTEYQEDLNQANSYANGNKKYARELFISYIVQNEQFNNFETKSNADHELNYI